MSERSVNGSATRSRHGPRPEGGSGTRLSGLAAAIFAISLISGGLWSLAGTGFDPLGGALVRGGSLVNRYVDWIRTDPLSGTQDWAAMRYQVLAGDPANAPRIMREKGCGACHVIPGLSRAQGSVGPDLTGIAGRAYLAGILPNNPGQMVRWLLDPTVYAPQTAMPDLALTEAEAKDIAAYLYGSGPGPRADAEAPPA